MLRIHLNVPCFARMKSISVLFVRSLIESCAHLSFLYLLVCSTPHASDLCFSPSLLEPCNLNGLLAHFEGQPAPHASATSSAALSSVEQPSLGALISLIRLTCNCMVDMFRDLKDVRESSSCLDGCFDVMLATARLNGRTQCVFTV